MAIEQAFGQLKGQWHILLGIVLSFNITRICKIIYVCCILHNICIERNEEECEVPDGVFEYDVFGEGEIYEGLVEGVNETRRDQVVAELLAQY